MPPGAIPTGCATPSSTTPNGSRPARQEPQWINEQIKRMAVQGDLFA